MCFFLVLFLVKVFVNVSFSIFNKYLAMEILNRIKKTLASITTNLILFPGLKIVRHNSGQYSKVKFQLKLVQLTRLPILCNPVDITTSFCRPYQRYLTVMDVGWTSKRRLVLAGNSNVIFWGDIKIKKLS